MIDPKWDGFQSIPVPDIHKALSEPSDTRLFAIANAMMDQDMSINEIHDKTKIDPWFLYVLIDLF